MEVKIGDQVTMQIVGEVIRIEKVKRVVSNNRIIEKVFYSVNGQTADGLFTQALGTEADILAKAKMTKVKKEGGE